MHDEGRSDDLQSQDVHQGRRFMRSHLLIKDQTLNQRRAPPTVLPGPRDPGPAAFVDLLLPGFEEREVSGRGVRLPVAQLGGRWRHVSGEPGAQFLAKGLLLRSEGKVHASLLTMNAEV